MLTRGQLVDRLSEKGAGDRRHVNNMLKHLEAVAAEEILAGEDFVIPGVAKVFFQYTPPKKKGERWHKGDTVTGFGGQESVKDAESPAVKAKIKLRANPIGGVAKMKPGANPQAQSEFLKSRTGKSVVKRKGR